MSPRVTSSWVMATKGGVVDKSEAVAPTYPPMRSSDLRSSGQLVRLEIASMFFFAKMRTCFSEEIKLPTNQINICFSDKKTMCLSGKENLLMKFSHNHK